MEGGETKQFRGSRVAKSEFREAERSEKPQVTQHGSGSAKAGRMGAASVCLQGTLAESCPLHTAYSAYLGFFFPFFLPLPLMLRGEAEGTESVIEPGRSAHKLEFLNFD